MGKIRKIREDELVGASSSEDLYPITSVLAVYTEDSRVLSDVLNEINAIDISSIPYINKVDAGKLNLGKSINPGTGLETTNASRFNSNFLDVKGYTSLFSQIYANGNIYAYNEDFGFIQRISPNIADNTGEYILPGGCRYIRLEGASSIIGRLYLYTTKKNKFIEYGVTEDHFYIDEQISEVNQTISELGDVISIRSTSNQYINKINYVTDFIDGKIINSLGVLVDSSTGCVSVFIDVLGINNFYSSTYAYGGIMGYDENMKLVKTLSSTAGGFSGAYTVESGIRYIRMSISNSSLKNKLFLYTREEDLSTKVNIYNAVYYEYGITYTDIEHRKELDVVPTKLDKFNTMYINSINIFTTDLIQEQGAFIDAKDGVTIVKSGATARQSYSYFIPVVGGHKVSSNIRSYGSILTYDKDKNYLGVLSDWVMDARAQSYVATSVLNDNVAFIRFSAPIEHYDIYNLTISLDEVHKIYDYGDKFDIHFKYRGKKLVTIGDSLTYQRSWQDRLCELTGLWYNPQEVRGANEGTKTEGYGYILLTSELEDTDTYYEEVEGITKTEETIVDEFGYAHPIWTDSSGNKYRQPCRMAEGGETVMPVRETSIYSRASDSKYYKGDVIIVFAGANDKVAYINKYPTTAPLNEVQGLTNLKTDSEDTTEATFEIYMDDAKLSSTGNYSDVGETTGIQKYNYTFRACFRGMLKRVVDANPDAKIIVIGPFATMIKANDYISRGYDYLTVEQNKVIEECAREFSCQYINLFPLFGRYRASKFFGGTDGTIYIHPTSDGGKEIAEYIASMIQ